MKKLLVVVGVCLSCGVVASMARAQASADASTERARRVQFCATATAETMHTYYLSNVSQPNDGNEIQTALRNLLAPDSSKVYFVPSQNAIMICTPPDQQTLVAKMIRDLDRPRKGFRVSYTFTELESGKRVGTQHYSLIVSNGQRVTVKQGSRVPIATGTSGAAGETQTQYQYLDVGMNFDVTFTETAGGGLLKSKVEQTSLAEDKSGFGAQDPIVRQSSYEGSPMVVLGKPAILSSLDIPNSTRHMDVEVMVEEVK